MAEKTPKKVPSAGRTGVGSKKPTRQRPAERLPPAPKSGARPARPAVLAAAAQALALPQMPPLPNARLVGKADPNEPVQVTIGVRRKPGAPPLPDHDHWMRTPPRDRTFLSPEEFTARYGAAQEEIDTVAEFGRSNGLTVIEAHPGRRSVVLTGSVAQMNTAFGVELSYYEAPNPERFSKFARMSDAPQTQTYRGYTGTISLPGPVADVVELVAGLDNRRTGGRNWTSNDPPNISTLTVPQVVAEYDFPTNSAAGQMIGVVSMGGGYDPADITTYFAGFAGTLTAPTIVPRSVNSGTNLGNDFETLQDICISSSVAQGATIAVYFVTTTGLGDYQAWLNLLNRLIVPDPGETAPAVMTSSYFVAQSDDGTQVTIANQNAVSAKFQEVAARGITFFIAAGDSGSDSGVGDGKVHVQYPGSDPWVTSCGGTALGTDAHGALDETVWNDSSGATGGGVSDAFPLPAWQTQAGVPPSFNDGKVRRGVPDIAGNASSNSGYPMSGGGQPFNGSGTSAVAPLYAGLAACLNAASAQPIGFLNPTLYALGESVFRDITVGNNMWGNPGNAATQAYSAGPGWDACTGWGVIDGNALKRFFGPAIAVNLQDDLHFGTVCEGPAYRVIHVYNVGNSDLMILSVQRVAGSTDFTVLSAPTTPLAIAPGAQVDFTVAFNPTTAGVLELATIRITSNDPVTPNLDVEATGTGGIAALETVIPDNGDFGNACLGSFVDELLTINNSGTCPLLISSITASPGFLAPSVLAYPLRVDSGDSIDVVIRFQPSNPGATPGTITIVSNDPASPHVVPVLGAAPAPKANVIIADTGDFGEVRLGKFVDRDLVINNLGPCPLSVTGIVSAAPVVFVTPSVVGFPLTVDGGDSIAVPIRFQPTNRGSAASTLTISSNDPGSPAVVNVSGTAWPPLPIAGSPIEGYRLSNDSQHVNYIGTDKHVHELYVTAGAAWVDNDLTEEAGAVPPKATSALDGYRLSDDSQHVFFIGTDNHVYELYITAGAGWIYNDLTALARAVPPNPTSALDGYRLSDDSKHVFFIGTDGHVHELQIARGGRWVDNDLTTMAGAVPPKATSALDGFSLSDDSEHVNFIGTDSHVHELTHTGAGWVDNDLTTLAGAVPPIPTTALDGYPLSNDSKHVNFIGTDNHVHELYFTAAAGWVDNDLTALT
jgi:hypothetical protein